MSRDDLNELLNGAVELATEQLQDASEFMPFALAIQASDGEILHLEPEEEEAREEAGGRDPDDMRAALVEGLRRAALEGHYRAVAVVSEVTLENDDGEPVSSAILVALEHADDEPVNCIVPYEIGEDDIELAELMAERGERVVFGERVDN
jgi:hypothetical protein